MFKTFVSFFPDTPRINGLLHLLSSYQTKRKLQSFGLRRYTTTSLQIRIPQSNVDEYLSLLRYDVIYQKTRIFRFTDTYFPNAGKLEQITNTPRVSIWRFFKFMHILSNLAHKAVRQLSVKYLSSDNDRYT
jgi:hypothetical protein